MTANLENLEAWAIEQGYDPDKDYTDEALPDGYLSPHFKEAEFACNHCGKLPKDKFPPEELIDILEDVRKHFNAPVVVNSGYRCPTHNANVGGATKSQHLLGTAADIQVRGVKPSAVYAYLDPGHEGGLGAYPTFTHVDVRPYRARWSG